MNALSQDLSGPDTADLAAAAFAMARRFASGATLWCAAPSRPSRAEQAAAEFLRPAVATARALPVATVPGDHLLEDLRRLSVDGDVLLLVAGRDEPSVAGLRQRAAAWGILTVWIGAGPRPLPGAADYVLWLDDEAISSDDGRFTPLYRRLCKLTHDRLEHPELLEPEQGACTDEVCITCSDEGRLGEVVAICPDSRAQVRTPAGVETVDTSLIDGARPGDLVVIHAGAAVALVTDEPSAPEAEHRATGQLRRAADRRLIEAEEAP
jgi:hydrogenase maturation factor